MVKDPGYLSDAAKIGVVINYAPGQDIVALSQRMYAYPQDVVARAIQEYNKASGK